MSKRLTPADYAAYILDRADQYVTDSGCWSALADVAHNIMRGEVATAKKHGELDKDLYQRLARMTGPAKPVVPTAGIDE